MKVLEKIDVMYLKIKTRLAICSTGHYAFCGSHNLINLIFQAEVLNLTVQQLNITEALNIAGQNHREVNINVPL